MPCTVYYLAIQLNYQMVNMTFLGAMIRILVCDGTCKR